MDQGQLDVVKDSNGNHSRKNSCPFTNGSVGLDIVKIHLSGTTYELDVDDVRRAPESRLYKYVFSGKKLDLTFKRPIQSFEAVLAYYQTGELHMPTSVCPGAFRAELAYWGLDPQMMSKCCYYRSVYSCCWLIHFVFSVPLNR